MDSLENFLKSRGIELHFEHRENKVHDGYMSFAQKEQFTKTLLKYPNIQKIAEIGLNAGHSAEHFFQTCPNLHFFASFDMNCYPCTRIAVEYFYKTYPGRFLYIQGDSLLKVPELHKKVPALKFDLIYIDGCHLFEWCLGDIMNCQKIASPETLLWIDDVDSDLQNGVWAAVQLSEKLGIVRIENKFPSYDPLFGKRNWIAARYCS